jgi:hypothetical protein
MIDRGDLDGSRAGVATKIGDGAARGVGWKGVGGGALVSARAAAAGSIMSARISAAADATDKQELPVRLR